MMQLPIAICLLASARVCCLVGNDPVLPDVTLGDGTQIPTFEKDYMMLNDTFLEFVDDPNNRSVFVLNETRENTVLDGTNHEAPVIGTSDLAGVTETSDQAFADETDNQALVNETGNQAGINGIDDTTDLNKTDYSYYYYDESIERVLIDHAVWVTSAPGVVCNTITIIVVCSMTPFTTNSLFIFALGMTDLFNVLARIGIALIYFLSTVTDVSCKLFDFVILTTFNYSNAILVIWTVERFIAVWFPIKYNIYCTFRRTLIALITVCVILCVLSIPYLIDAHAREDEYGFIACEYSEFLYEIWTPIETTYYIWIPLIVIFTLNVLIVHRLFSNNKERVNHAISSERAERRSREQIQMTKVLMSVSLAFLILHIPHACATLYLSLASGKLEEFITDSFSPLKSLLWCFIFTEFQNSINFVLYCLSGRDFRARVCALLYCCKSDTDTVAETKNARLSGITQK